MKSRSLFIKLLFCSTVFMNSCFLDEFTETVYGDGNVVTAERSLEGFTSLRVSSGIDVYLSQGENYRVVLEADQNLHDHIYTDLTGTSLSIGSRVNIRKARSRVVYVTAPDINSINISSSGDVRGETRLVTRELDLGISSAGNLVLEVEAEEIRCNLSSSGDARLSGKAGSLTGSLSSAGNLEAYGLVVENCRLNVSSAGNARIHVTGELDATVSSAGDVYYMGDPKIINVRTSSAGRVHKK